VTESGMEVSVMHVDQAGAFIVDVSGQAQWRHFEDFEVGEIETVVGDVAVFVGRSSAGLDGQEFAPGIEGCVEGLTGIRVVPSEGCAQMVGEDEVVGSLAGEVFEEAWAEGSPADSVCPGYVARWVFKPDGDNLRAVVEEFHDIHGSIPPTP